MKSALSGLAVLLLSACASSSATRARNASEVTVHLAPLNTQPDVLYYAGPINLQFQLSITNPTNQPLALRRVDLETFGSGAFTLRTSGPPMNLKVPPGGTTNYVISVWGRSRGGYLAASEPVTIRGVAYFDSPSGPLLRTFNENIWPGR
jgi:hypothetical protein